MSNKQLFYGSCHCGVYRFQIELPEILSAVACNCSLCYKLGSLWGFALPGSIVITKGNETNLTKYTTPYVTVKFCNQCGIVVSGDHSGGPLAQRSAVNIRTLINVNPFEINIEQVDSKASEAPAYMLHRIEGVEPPSDGENLKLYTGSCHCGLVCAAVKSPSLSNIEMRECNCSICVRVAWIGVYARKEQVTVIGREHTKDYICGAGVQGWPFCRVCAVHVFANAYGPPNEIMETWPESRQAEIREQWDVLPLNLRALEDIDLNLFSVERSDEGTDGYVLD